MRLVSCGWYHEDTSASLYLQDADGLWAIWEQGGISIPIADGAFLDGFDDRTVRDYGGNIVATDYAKHGFSCVCIDGDFGEASLGDVHSIDHVTTQPLAHCEADPNLPEVQLSGQ